MVGVISPGRFLFRSIRFSIPFYLLVSWLWLLPHSIAQCLLLTLYKLLTLVYTRHLDFASIVLLHMYITLSLPQRGGLEDSLPTFFFLYNSAIEKPVLIYSTSIQTQVGRSVGDLYKSRNRIGFWSENGAALTETSIINFGSTNFTDVSTLIATHIAHATASFRAVVSNNISSLRHCALYTLIEPRVVNQLDRYIYYAASVGCISQGHSPPLSISLSLSILDIIYPFDDTGRETSIPHFSCCAPYTVIT